MSRRAGFMLTVFGIFTIPLLALWIIKGPEATSRGTAVRADLLTVLYPLGAAIAGAIFGLLEPVADRSRPAAMLVGIVALTPWVFGINLSMEHGYAHWTKFHTLLTVFMSLTFGSAFGFGYSRGPRDHAA